MLELFKPHIAHMDIYIPCFYLKVQMKNWEFYSQYSQSLYRIRHDGCDNRSNDISPQCFVPCKFPDQRCLKEQITIIDYEKT